MFPYTGLFFNSHLVPDMALDIRDSKASSIAPIFLEILTTKNIEKTNYVQ